MNDLSFWANLAAILTALIAAHENLADRYVEKIYRLNYLSPRIKEAILDGTQPRTLTLSRLMSDIPLSWDAQERLYGF